MSAFCAETIATALTVTVNMPGPIEDDAKALLVRIESALVESDEGYTALANALDDLKRRRDDHQNERIDLKKPVAALSRVIDAKFQAPIGILDSAIYIGKQKLVAYDNLKEVQADAQAAAEAQAREEAPKREAEAVAVAPRAAATAAAVAQVMGQAQFPVVLGNPRRRTRQMSWQWRVTDFSKIDRKWLCCDERVINKAVAEHKGDSFAVLGEGIEVKYEYAFGLTPNR
jgi:hypothetical protein